jgi:hypothetical protein
MPVAISSSTDTIFSNIRKDASQMGKFDAQHVVGFDVTKQTCLCCEYAILKNNQKNYNVAKLSREQSPTIGFLFALLL